MSSFTGFSEKSFFKKKDLKYGRSIGTDAIALNFLKELDYRLFHSSFVEIRFLKWLDVINSNSWFLAKLIEFSEGLPLFKLIFFFLKLKGILTKIDISCVKS